MANIYGPVAAGFAQSTYLDQMGTALPGQIANASDQWLIDTAIVHPDAGPDGLVAGIGVVLPVIPAAERTGYRLGINNTYAQLPTTTTTADDFGGILVRNQQMDSNSAGDACWFPRRASNVMRSNRVGGRIWVRLVNGAAVINGPVYWIISDTTSHGFQIGAFSAVAIGADTIELPGIAFRSEHDATGENGAQIALVELGRISISSGDTSALTARVTNLESGLSSAESSISTNTSNISTNTGKIATLETTTENLDTRVTVLESA